MIYIVGAGGVGSWLTPALCMLENSGNVTIIDGDTLEPKNLNRQLFSADDVGKNKAEALASRYGCDHIPEWFSATMTDFSSRDWLVGAVDNNPARREILNACDIYRCRAIFGANEVHSSEAYVYLPEWQGTNLDPRVYYNDIVTDRTGDVGARGAGCTGEAQVNNRQLVTANFMAASLIGHLFVVWGKEYQKVDVETRKVFPHKLVNNLSRNAFYKAGEPIIQSNERSNTVSPVVAR